MVWPNTVDIFGRIFSSGYSFSQDVYFIPKSNLKGSLLLKNMAAKVVIVVCVIYVMPVVICLQMTLVSKHVLISWTLLPQEERKARVFLLTYM